MPTTYSAILDTQLDPDAPITSALGYQLRDNPVAGFEGADTAPVNAMVWHPYDMTNMSAVGDDTAEGVIWDFSVDGSSTAVETPNFVSGYSYRVIGLNLDHDGAGSVNLDLYKATDAAYETVYGVSKNHMFIWEIIHPWITGVAHLGTVVHINNGTGGSGGTIAAAGLTDLTSQIISKARIEPSAGSPTAFDAGKIILEKRLDPLSGAIS